MIGQFPHLGNGAWVRIPLLSSFFLSSAMIGHSNLILTTAVNSYFCTLIDVLLRCSNDLIHRHTVMKILTRVLLGDNA
jgi:hypothetical protein